ncbi:MAG TPA: hypothetical protein EYN18_07385 [Nitrospirales bacterium]|nr:hypothetical protein [Nitrospirales bacterium]
MNSTTPNDLVLTLVRNAALSVGLLIALGFVFGLDNFFFSTAATPPGGGVTVTVTDKETEEEIVLPVKSLRLGVTPVFMDDVGTSLDTLGAGYRHEEVPLEDFLDVDKLKEYDVIFLTCGNAAEDWYLEEIGEGTRPGSVLIRMNTEVMEKVHRNIREYVEQGGTLYASDWRFTMIAGAFGEFVDHEKAIVGEKQIVNAEVIDKGLRSILGSVIKLNFDMRGWYPAVFEGPDVNVMLRGEYMTTEDKSVVESPLLVKFPFGQGSVIFTSFHNEKQNSDLETKLLQYLVFTAVTAKVEAKVTQTLVEGGFSPTSRNLLTASGDDPSITKTFQCKDPGPLRFVLGFQNEGAVLRLTVAGPDGEHFEKQGQQTLLVEVPQATLGEWKYTVTAVKVPYPNFPFNLTIGQK